MTAAFVGIDVGGPSKGFHAVLASAGVFHARFQTHDLSELTAWCLGWRPSVIAIDAPCRYSVRGGSRQAERDLNGDGIRCFYTPQAAACAGHLFYTWVVNGQRLYDQLAVSRPLHADMDMAAPDLIETFPHAVARAIAGIPPAGVTKARFRRQALMHAGYEGINHLVNLDYIDAALCAVGAEAYSRNQVKRYGDAAEGYIVVPVRGFSCRL